MIMSAVTIPADANQGAPYPARGRPGAGRKTKGKKKKRLTGGAYRLSPLRRYPRRGPARRGVYTGFTTMLIHSSTNFPRNTGLVSKCLCSNFPQAFATRYRELCRSTGSFNASAPLSCPVKRARVTYTLSSYPADRARRCPLFGPRSVYHPRGLIFPSIYRRYRSQ